MSRQLLSAHCDQRRLDVFSLALEDKEQAAAPRLADQTGRAFLATKRQANLKDIAVELVDAQNRQPLGRAIRDTDIVIFGCLGRAPA